jgi:imidazole glycerol-phosphate synthase subunit HisF
VLKKRIIPVQLLIDNRLVKTIQFDKHRNVGNPVSSSKIYNDSDADELIFLNINREVRSIEPMLKLIKSVSEVCFMPLSIGGGIKTLDDASKLIKNGADKVIINSMAYRNYQLIKEISETFGSQAIIISIDVRKNILNSAYQLYSDCGRILESVSLEEHISKCVGFGAGEICISSIDMDGTMQGYDIGLINNVTSLVNVPVIGQGGAGTFSHLKEAFIETDVSALACGSLFNFGDNNPIRAKSFLSNYSIPFKII